MAPHGTVVAAVPRGCSTLAGLLALAVAAVTQPAAAYDTSAPAASGIAASDMRLQPLDNATPPGFAGIWGPYVDGKWLNFDLDFTNGGSAIELVEAEVRYRDSSGEELAAVTVPQAALAFAVLNRGAAPPAFARTGGALTNLAGIDSDRIADLAFDPDGRIVAVGQGHMGALAGVVGLPPDGFLAARYDRDGALDPSLDGNGVLDVELGHLGTEGATSVLVSGLAIYIGGQAIVLNDPVLGEATRYWALAALDVNGIPEPLFGDGGTLLLTEDTAGGWITDLAFGQDSRLLAVGMVEVEGIRRAAVARITLSGEIDPTFGLRIATSFLPLEHESRYTGVALDSQERIYVAGWHGPPQELDSENPLQPRTWFIARFQENGLRDDSFGVEGVAEVLFADFPLGYPSALAIDAEDRIVTAGGVSEDEGITSSIAVVRHLPSGEIDQDFAQGGALITDAGLGGIPSATEAAIDTEDRIVLSVGSLGAFVVLRLAEDGSFDESFGEGGVAAHDHPGARDQGRNFASTLAIASGNRIIVGGGANHPALDEPVFALLRLLEDGRLDSSAFVPSGERVILAMPDEALYDDERAMPFGSDETLPATVDIALQVRATGSDETWALEWTGIEPGIFTPAPLPDGLSYLFPLLPPDNLINDQELSYSISGGHELRYGNTETHHRRVVQSISGLVASNDQRFAYDIVAVDEDGNAAAEGEPIEDPGNASRYAWGQTVIAVAGGDIVQLDRSQPENPEPGVKLEDIPRGGNSLTIDHGNGEFSHYSHLQVGTIPADLAVFPCMAPDRCTLAAGDVLGLVGNSGNSEGPHLHFVLMDGSNADIDEGLPIFFGNVMFDGLLQTSVSLHSGTRVEEVLPAPSEIGANPASPAGEVNEIEPNDALGQHHALSLPTTVHGRIGQGETPSLAVRGDGIEDIFRVDLAARGQLSLKLAAVPEAANLDLYLIDAHYNLLNPGTAGWGPEGQESFTALAGPGPLYVLVSEAPGARPAEPGTEYTLEIDHRPYAYEYAAKVVCGTQEDAADLRLARGLYATTVNIHNPGQNEAQLFKKLALSYPPEEQAPGAVLEIGEDRLGHDEALKTDCLDLRRRLFPGPDGFPAPVIEGFVVIQSSESLDVTAVYTTAALDAEGEPAGHSSIDVEAVAERALGVDLRIDKSAEVFAFPFGDRFTYFAVLYSVEAWNGGPATATAVTLTDSLALSATGAVGVVAVLPAPIELPPGGALEHLNQLSPTEVSFQLAFGDLAAGTGRRARFWALAAVYETDSPVAAHLTDSVTLGGAEAELLGADNEAIVETQLLP